MKRILVCDQCHSPQERNTGFSEGGTCYWDRCGPDIGTFRMRMLGEKTRHTARYFNANSMQTAIVASFTEGTDWSAYIGATKDAYYQKETEDWTLQYGGKLLEEDARHFFPNIRLPYRP